jgi:hypothetical protein
VRVTDVVRLYSGDYLKEVLGRGPDRPRYNESLSTYSFYDCDVVLVAGSMSNVRFSEVSLRIERLKESGSLPSGLRGLPISRPSLTSVQGTLLKLSVAADCALLADPDRGLAVAEVVDAEGAELDAISAYHLSTTSIEALRRAQPVGLLVFTDQSRHQRELRYQNVRLKRALTGHDSGRGSYSSFREDEELRSINSRLEEVIEIAVATKQNDYWQRLLRMTTDTHPQTGSVSSVLRATERETRRRSLRRSGERSLLTLSGILTGHGERIGRPLFAHLVVVLAWLVTLIGSDLLEVAWWSGGHWAYRFDQLYRLALPGLPTIGINPEPVHGLLAVLCRVSAIAFFASSLIAVPKRMASH